MVKIVSKDRRVFARFNSRIPLRYKNLNTGLTAEVFLRDIGGGGLKFITSERLVEPSDLVEIWIEAPNSLNPVHLKGKIMWLREVGRDVWDVGVSFNRARLVSLSRACSSLNMRTL
jgi:hypothetical protein